ncbi:MAG TPA: prohibitin family protein [Verrucomicrobiae bacterium]|nr:prohibitin family protein [Verrucomicrobiae bacterium]
MPTPSIARLVGIGILILALIVGLASGTYIVPAGHRGVLVTLGKVSPESKPEGFGLKTPFVTTIVPVSIRQKTEEMDSAVISKDLQEVRTRVKVLYRIPEVSAVQIYQQFKGDPFTSLIQPRVDEAIKEVTKEHTAQQIVQDRATIKSRTLESARHKIGNLLTIVDVVVEDIALSANLEAAIERKMVQEQEANKAVFEQQKAQIDAQIAVVRAKGEAESISIRGEALAQNPELIDLEIVRKWNGRAPRVVGNEASGARMILPLSREDFTSTNSSVRLTEANR